MCFPSGLPFESAAWHNSPYGASQAIRLENVSVNGGAIAAIGDVAVHKAAYLGDADGSGIHSAADAFLVVQAALGLATGFSSHAWTDPRIVGDAGVSAALVAAGHLRGGLVGAGGAPLAPGLREIARLRFQVADHVAASGPDAIPLAEQAGDGRVSGLGEAGLVRL